MIRHEFNIIPFLRSRIGSLDQHCVELLMLPVLLTEQLVPEIYARFSIHHQNLDDLEAAAGQHEYSNLVRGDPLELDFVSSTGRLNFIGNGICIDVLRIKCTLSALAQMVEWGHVIEMQKRKGLNTATRLGNALPEDATVLTAKIAYFRDTCNVLLVEAECEEKRIRALSEAVSSVLSASIKREI